MPYLKPVWCTHFDIMPINDVYVIYLCVHTKHDFISAAQIFTFDVNSTANGSLFP